MGECILCGRQSRQISRVLGLCAACILDDTPEARARDADQVQRIGEFIARLDPSIPYSLLAFHPGSQTDDLPTTSRRQARDCLAAAEATGLKRVRIGNVHLLT